MRFNKKKKKWLAILLCVLFAAGIGTGLWFYFQYRNDSKTVEVIPVTQVSDGYWGDDVHSQGLVTSDYSQELYPDSTRVISDIFVQEGDQVAIGDTLLQYDRTRLELDVESKQLQLTETDLNIENAQKQLKKLQNTKPASTVRPTTTPRPTRTPRPTQTPSPTPVPTPTPIPPATVTLYSQLDLSSRPYAGSGTSEDPYLFLCTEDCTMTTEFLQWLLGDEDIEVPEITPSPSSEPDSGDSEGSEEDSSEPDEDSGDDEPLPPDQPAEKYASPFAAIFEVREENSNFGSLLSSFGLDGIQLSANMQVPKKQENPSGIASVETVVDAFEAAASPTPTPTPNTDNYNHMNYSSTELKALIAEKKQEIKDLQYQRKQAKLALDRAQLALKNSTVLSTVDGVVRTLTDLDTAMQNNTPFLVVSGAEQYYLTGSISENLLGVVNVGDSVTASSWETGQTYNAQIVSISDYPLEEEGYYGGGGNPNSSNYEFTAVIAEGESLRNGLYLDVTMSISGGSSSGALYLWKAYMKEDDSGFYVWKVGPDNRLQKQYLETGKMVWGDYFEIKSGLTSDDYIAFPATDIREGSKVRLEGSEEVFQPYGDGAESSFVGTEGSFPSGWEEFPDASDSGEENGLSSEGADSSPSEESFAENDEVQYGGTIVGSDEGVYFKTEDGGGVMLR